MEFSAILLSHVSDGDLHTKLKDVEYSTNLREIITVGDMLRAENLKGGVRFVTVGEMLMLTKRLLDITSSNVPVSIKNDRLENLMLDIEDAFVNDEYATQLYSAVREAKIDP